VEQLIDYIAKWIVDEPDEVKLSTEGAEGDEPQPGDRVLIHLEVDQDDMGRIIGRDGRLASAMRTLLSVAGHARGVDASLEIR